MIFGTSSRSVLPRLWSAVVVALPVLALFKMPEPLLIYTGSAPGTDPGVVVLRDLETFKQEVASLEPGFGGELPDLDKRTVLRIVSRARENGCRDAVLKEVGTRGMTAYVKVEERVPQKNCICTAVARPPIAWLVTVTRLVRRASVEVTDVVVPCEAAVSSGAAVPANAALIFEGSWDGSPGTQLLTDEAAYRGALKVMGLTSRGPEVDFSKHHVAIVTGRPRQNSCRQTAVTKAQLTSPNEVGFDVEEIYPAAGQMCAQVMLEPKVFMYTVPASVTSAKVTVTEKK